jgi:hypothetical protein
MYYKFVLAKTGSMTADIAVYTEYKENWQYFFNQATMTPDSPGDVDKIVQVKEHNRRRGPGDSGTKVIAHPRKYVRSPKSKGSARPGKTWVVTEPAVMGGGYRERRQFSIQGLDMDVIAYAKAKAKFLLHLTNEAGWTSKIDGATTQTVTTP